jgi:hypothetical protein
MSAKHAVIETVSDSAYPIPSYVRARAHITNLIGNKALRHCNEKTAKPAVTVDALLHWAYAREKVHLARLPGLDMGARLRPRGFATSASSERVGAAVGSSMNMGFEAPRDAYAVASVVNGVRDAALLRERALIGEAPDWTPRPVVTWEQGPAIYGRDAKGRVGRRIVAYVVFARGDLPAIVEERRAVYSRWVAALSAVRDALVADDLLADHVLVDDLPATAPWL